MGGVCVRASGALQTTAPQRARSAGVPPARLAPARVPLAHHPDPLRLLPPPPPAPPPAPQAPPLRPPHLRARSPGPPSLAPHTRKCSPPHARVLLQSVAVCGVGPEQQHSLPRARRMSLPRRARRLHTSPRSPPCSPCTPCILARWRPRCVWRGGAGGRRRGGGGQAHPSPPLRHPLAHTQTMAMAAPAQLQRPSAAKVGARIGGGGPPAASCASLHQRTIAVGLTPLPARHHRTRPTQAFAPRSAARVAPRRISVATRAQAAATGVRVGRWWVARQRCRSLYSAGGAEAGAMRAPSWGAPRSAVAAHPTRRSARAPAHPLALPTPSTCSSSAPTCRWSWRTLACP